MFNIDGMVHGDCTYEVIYRPGGFLTVIKAKFVEVRDSRMGYLVPVRYGIGVWPDTKIVGVPLPKPSRSPSSGNSGQPSGQGTIFEIFPDGNESW